MDMTGLHFNASARTYALRLGFELIRVCGADCENLCNADSRCWIQTWLDHDKVEPEWMRQIIRAVTQFVEVVW